MVLNTGASPTPTRPLSIETEDLSEPELQSTRVPGNPDPGPEISLTDVCQLRGEAHSALHGLIQVCSLREGREGQSAPYAGGSTLPGVEGMHVSWASGEDGAFQGVADITAPFSTPQQEKFLEITRLHFRTVPSNPHYFFYCPPSSRREVSALLPPSHTSNPESQRTCLAFLDAPES